MAFVVLSEPSPRQAIESILRRTTYILVPFSLVLIRYFPEYGRVYSRWSGEVQWVGVTLQKNGLGRLCLIGIFYLIWTLVKRRQGHYAPVYKYQTHAEVFVLALTVWLMKGPGIQAYSATAVSALAFGLLVYVGLHFMKKRKKEIGAGALVIIIGLIILFGIVTLFTGGSAVGSFAPSIGRNSTLTDRTGVWKALLPVAMRHPFVGSGIGGFWTSGTRERFEISEAHSGYLDALLAFGFVGVLLLSLFLLSSGRKAARELAQDFDWGTLWICYLMMAAVHNITESSIHSFTSQLTAVILFFSISSTSAISRNKES